MNGFGFIGSSDSRVPCACCDALVPPAQAEANAAEWQQAICDDCAQQYAEDWAMDSAEGRP